MYYSILHDVSYNLCTRLRASDLFNRPWPTLPLRERRSVVDLFSLNRHRWRQWMLEHPRCKGFGKRLHVVPIVLVAAIGIALGDGDGGGKATEGSLTALMLIVPKQLF